MTLILLLFVGAVVFLWYMSSRKNDSDRRKGLKTIPGPKGLPFLGSIFKLGKYQHEQHNKWTAEYGEIYQINLGSTVNIVVSNPKMIKEMFSEASYTGRPHFDGFDIYEDERLGIVNSEGELWEVHRRFLLRQLRDFGFGKAAMESLILEELNEVLSKFKRSEGTPVKEIKKTLTLAVVNALWAVVGGQRFPHDDPKLLKLVENTDKAIEEVIEKAGILFAFPWMRNVIPEISGYNAFRRVMEDQKEWFQSMVDQHKQTFQEDNMRDFIDVYLAEVSKTSDAKSVFYGAPAERQLIATLSDLFFAGSDTTSTTLAWGILYLCKNPKIQQKFQQEITSLTNNSRNVLVSDRPNMPYTVALIDEILRCSSIVPDGVPHRVLEDREFQGYFIPKDAWILPNMHYLHHDPKVWGDPENFRPERFMSADGKKYEKSDKLIAFQIGRRQCVGETLARDTVFLFLTNIFQRFTIELDPNTPEPSLEPKPIFILSPQPYSVIMKDRAQP